MSDISAFEKGLLDLSDTEFNRTCEVVWQERNQSLADIMSWNYAKHRTLDAAPWITGRCDANKRANSQYEACKRAYAVRRKRAWQQLQAPRKCGGCGRTDGKLSQCSGCKMLAYCSSTCQAKDWSASHKGACRQLNSKRLIGAFDLVQKSRLCRLNQVDEFTLPRPNPMPVTPPTAIPPEKMAVATGPKTVPTEDALKKTRERIAKAFPSKETNKVVAGNPEGLIATVQFEGRDVKVVDWDVCREGRHWGSDGNCNPIIQNIDLTNLADLKQRVVRLLSELPDPNPDLPEVPKSRINHVHLSGDMSGRGRVNHVFYSFE